MGTTFPSRNVSVIVACMRGRLLLNGLVKFREIRNGEDLM